MGPEFPIGQSYSIRHARRRIARANGRPGIPVARGLVVAYLRECGGFPPRDVWAAITRTRQERA